LTTATFETSTLADCIKKVERIAPSKGAAFDKAAGIVVEIYPKEETVIIRATNLEVYYMEWITALELTGDPVIWRLPSAVFAALIGSLPIGMGKTVTLTQEAGTLAIASGRTKSKLRLISTATYPEWDVFEDKEMSPVPNLGGQIGAVEYAASKQDYKLGVRLTGQHVMATDRYRLARMPLEISGIQGDGITIPPNVLTSVIREMSDSKVKVDANQFLIMPDATTQIRTVIIDEGYPAVSRIMDRDFPERIHLRKADIADIVSRTMKISQAERFPILKLIFGRGEIGAMIEEQEHGFIGDVLSCPGYAEHPRYTYLFSPQYFLDAISNAPGDDIEVCYDPNFKNAVLITGGGEYRAWVMGREDKKQ
jgi:DNA polymerase III sliding clamp (beta) subunit (PCNA family)